jgi:hypothetical protein
MSNLRPIPTDLRDHLSELTGNEYTVWTAYYLRTGDYDLTAHPSNSTIERDTGLSNRTVKTSKAGLIAKGWLAYTGDYKQPRHAEGTYAVPVMEVRIPWRQDWSAVVMDANMAYNTLQTVVQDLPHRTVVQNLHPEGYVSGFGSIGLDLDSSSLHVRGASLPCGTSKDKIEAKSKPANLEPTPTPAPKPTPILAMAEKSEGHAKKARYAPDGTPWPLHFNLWSNVERLEWLGVHGCKHDGMVETSSQQLPRSAVANGKPTPAATSLHEPPSSATPPIPICVRCDELCAMQQGEWVCDHCNLRQPVLRRPEPELDNWDEL